MLGRRNPLDEIDSELIILQAKRAEALDEIVARFFSIVAIDNRVELLLDRRFAAQCAESLRPARR